MKIVDIKSEFEEINRLIEEESEGVNPETGEFFSNTKEINELLEGLKSKQKDLINFLAKKRAFINSSEKFLSSEIKRLQDRKSGCINQQKRLLETIDFILEGEKVKTELYTFYYAKSESVSILNESDVPAEFINFTPKIAVYDIKKALKRGDEVNGATLETKISLRVR